MNQPERSVPSTAPQLSRRYLLGAGGALGVAAVAGCTDTSDVPDTNANKAAAGEFNIPDNPELPSSGVKLRWTDSGDQKAVFFKAFFKAYQAKHPNIDVNYSGTNWPAIQKEITLGVRNGTAPDVFQLPGTITIAQAVANKWVGAFDDVVPNWSEVKKRFPVGQFAVGITDFDNKTYAIPITSTQRMNVLTLFNKSLTDSLGYDLSQPLTWQDFRKLAKAITKKGNGQYYGLIMALAQANGLQAPVDTMCWLSGVHGGASSINWQTGDYNYTNPLVAEALNLFLAMKADGSIFPGSTSLIAATARGRFPQGVAGMIMQGPWNIAPWTQGNPDFKLGLNVAPVHDPNNIWPMGVKPGGSNPYVYSRVSKNGPVIGDIFAYLCSEPGQVQWADLDGAADPAAFPQALKNARLDPLSAQANEIAQKYTILMPEPAVRNPDVQLVYEAQKPPQPDFADVCVGLFTGQIRGVEKAMKDLQDRSNKALDEAIKTATKRGAKVSRDDWKFPDWDPKTPYTKGFDQ